VWEGSGWLGVGSSPIPGTKTGSERGRIVCPAFGERNRVWSNTSKVDDSSRGRAEVGSLLSTRLVRALLLVYGHCQRRYRARPEDARPVCARVQQGSTEHKAERGGEAHTRMEATFEASLRDRQAESQTEGCKVRVDDRALQ
jgi:hypothetical protein